MSSKRTIEKARVRLHTQSVFYGEAGRQNTPCAAYIADRALPQVIGWSQLLASHDGREANGALDSCGASQTALLGIVRLSCILCITSPSAKVRDVLPVCYSTSMGSSLEYQLSQLDILRAREKISKSRQHCVSEGTSRPGAAPLKTCALADGLLPNVEWMR